MCHRCWLAPKHKRRLNDKDFDGTHELRNHPKRLDGDDIFKKIDKSR